MTRASGTPAAADWEHALDFLGQRLERGRPLGPLCSYRVGGRARGFVEVSDPEELGRIARAVAAMEAARRPQVLVVGRGSNLLVADRGFDGLALTLGAGFAEQFELVETDSGVLVTVGGAARLPVVARRTVAAGLRGFEWAVGVPGSIGGAVRMNAGGHGAELAEQLRGVRLVDLSTGEDVTVSTEQLDLGYRRSSLTPTQVVVQATLSLRPGDRDEGERLIDEIVQWRRAHQPGGQNAGSVFTNPPGDSAGRLIDAAGCKGMRVGTAHVSEKHANFIQADPGGSADDVVALMARVAERVAQHSGVVLHPETVLVGFDAPDGRSG